MNEMLDTLTRFGKITYGITRQNVNAMRFRDESGIDEIICSFVDHLAVIYR